jgi:hypothetical protein
MIVLIGRCSIPSRGIFSSPSPSIYFLQFLFPLGENKNGAWRWPLASNISFLMYLCSSYPNFAVELLALILDIWEVPGSNLGPETGYPDFSHNSFLTATSVKMNVPWDVASCSLIEIDQRSLLWWWRQWAPLQRSVSAGLHGATSQGTVIFETVYIV